MTRIAVDFGPHVVPFEVKAVIVVANARFACCVLSPFSDDKSEDLPGRSSQWLYPAFASPPFTAAHDLSCYRLG